MKLQKQFVRKNEYNKVKGPSKKAVFGFLGGAIFVQYFGGQAIFQQALSLYFQNL